MSWIFMLEMIFTRKQNNFHKKNCLKNKKYFYPVNIFVLLETKKTLVFDILQNRPVRRWSKNSVRFLIFPFHNSYLNPLIWWGFYQLLLDDMFQGSIFNLFLFWKLDFNSNFSTCGATITKTNSDLSILGIAVFPSCNFGCQNFGKSNFMVTYKLPTVLIKM